MLQMLTLLIIISVDLQTRKYMHASNGHLAPYICLSQHTKLTSKLGKQQWTT
jgi:hypothetical protein